MQATIRILIFDVQVLNYITLVQIKLIPESVELWCFYIQSVTLPFSDNANQ